MQLMIMKKTLKIMIIQSKKVWIADQFTPAQLELEDGIIKEI